MSKKIKAIIKRPDEMYGHVSWISDTLENLQRTVGGYIEAVPIGLFSVAGEPVQLLVICDEEGRLNGKEPNCQLDGVDFFGTIALVGGKGEEFTDVPIAWGEYKRLVNGPLL